MKRRCKTQATLDGFLSRSPKVSPASSPTKKEGVMRQATLESLKGVVVVEEMERARVVLERTDVSNALKVDTLQHLLRKNPAKEVLIRTKLGKAVHKLCRDEDSEVAAAAQQVYTAWKEHILSKLNRPYIEVKCDLKTQKLRKSAREMLLEALQRETEEGGGEHNNSKGQDGVLERKETKHEHKRKDKDAGNSTGRSTHKRPRDDDSDGEKHVHKTKINQEEEEEKGKNKDRQDHNRLKESSHTEKHKPKKLKIQEEDEEGSEDKRRHKRASEVQDTPHDSVDTLAEHVERELYQCYSRRVDNGYRRTIRAMVFTLRHQSDVRKAVVSATLSVEDFIKQHRKS